MNRQSQSFARNWVSELTNRVFDQSEVRKAKQKGVRIATLAGPHHRCTLSLMESLGVDLAEVISFEDHLERFKLSQKMGAVIQRNAKDRFNIVTVNSDFLDIETMGASKFRKKLRGEVEPDDVVGFDVAWYDAEEKVGDEKFKKVEQSLQENGHLLFKRAWDRKLPGIFFCSHAVGLSSQRVGLARELEYLGANMHAFQFHKLLGSQPGPGIEAVHRTSAHGLSRSLNDGQSMCDFVHLGSMFYEGVGNDSGPKRKMDLMHLTGFAVFPRLSYLPLGNEKRINLMMDNLQHRILPKQ